MLYLSKYLLQGNFEADIFNLRLEAFEEDNERQVQMNFHDNQKWHLNSSIITKNQDNQ